MANKKTISNSDVHCRKQSSIEGAIRALREATRIDSSHARAWKVLGTCLYTAAVMHSDQQQMEESLEALRMSRACQGDDADTVAIPFAHIVLGSVEACDRSTLNPERCANLAFFDTQAIFKQFTKGMRGS